MTSFDCHCSIEVRKRKARSDMSVSPVSRSAARVGSRASLVRGVEFMIGRRMPYSMDCLSNKQTLLTSFDFSIYFGRKACRLLHPPRSKREHPLHRWCKYGQVNPEGNRHTIGGSSVRSGTIAIHSTSSRCTSSNDDACHARATPPPGEERASSERSAS